MAKFKMLVDGDTVITKDIKRKRIIKVNTKDHKFIVTNNDGRKVWIDSRDVEVAAMTIEYIINKMNNKKSK